NCGPEDLKSLLCPLFATSEQQQTVFYQAFDSFLPLLSMQEEAPEGSPTSSVQRYSRNAPAGLTISKWPYFGAALILSALLIAIAVWRSHNTAGTHGQTDVPGRSVP